MTSNRFTKAKLHQPVKPCKARPKNVPPALVPPPAALLTIEVTLEMEWETPDEDSESEDQTIALHQITPEHYSATYITAGRTWTVDAYPNQTTNRVTLDWTLNDPPNQAGAQWINREFEYNDETGLGRADHMYFGTYGATAWIEIHNA